jgi:hypothetical protein
VVLKMWHLGVVLAVALLGCALLLGYSLAPRGSSESTALTQELIQKDQQIAELQGQLTALRRQGAVEPAIAAGVGNSLQNPATAAEANVKAMLPSIESYNADNVTSGPHDPNGNPNDSGYTGETTAMLKQRYDISLPVSKDWISPADPGVPAGVTIPTPTAASYCAVSRVGAWYGWKLGPSGFVRRSRNPQSVCKS